MKTHLIAVMIAAPVALALSGCSHHQQAPEAVRPVRTIELRYGSAADTDRYPGTVRSRYEVDQAFRVGGKVTQRLVEIGQRVNKGDVLAVLDDTDYRLAEEAARQQLLAAEAHAQQAASDRKRLEDLKQDGSVSASDDEHAASSAVMSQASASAEARQLELARNRLRYTKLLASQSGVITSLRFEVGQVVAEGQPVLSIADSSEPEVVVDVPEDDLGWFKAAHFKAVLASEPDKSFEVSLRELAPQAAAQTRTFRARLKPVVARALPLGATATLLAQHAAAQSAVAVIPAAAITQISGKPAVWVVTRAESGDIVELKPIAVHGYRNDEVLISGPGAGARVVIAGVQKMAPGLHVAADTTPAQVLEAAR